MEAAWSSSAGPRAMRGEFDEFLHQTWQAMNKARICFGEGSEQASAWRKRVLGLALETGVDEVLDEITQTCRRTRSAVCATTSASGR